MHKCPCITLALTANKVEANKWGALWRFWGELISGTAADFLAVIKQPEISLERLLPCCGFHTLAHELMCVQVKCREGTVAMEHPLAICKEKTSSSRGSEKQELDCPAVITSPQSLPLTTYPGVFRTLTHSAPPSVKDCVTMESHKRRKNPHSNPL